MQIKELPRSFVLSQLCTVSQRTRQCLTGAPVLQTEKPLRDFRNPFTGHLIMCYIAPLHTQNLLEASTKIGQLHTVTEKKMERLLREAIIPSKWDRILKSLS